MKYIFAFLLVVLNLIHIPLSLLYKKTNKWYLPLWKTDKITYFAFAPFYWILALLVLLLSFLTEKLTPLAH